MLKKSNQYLASSILILIGLQLIVFIAWLIQLAMHQSWIGFISSWTEGLLVSTLLCMLPLGYCFVLLRNKATLPKYTIHFQDILFIILLISISFIMWQHYAEYAASFPMHTYGDESFHTTRVPIMAEDFHDWIRFLFHHHHTRPSFHAEYMFYPSLAYVPVTLWTMLLGKTASVSDQRLFLFINYLAVVLSTYLLARIMIQSKVISFFLALLPITSALLLSYTMSFYIELHYVSILILSFALLAWGVKDKSKEMVMTAIFVVSLAPITRESGVTGACGIIFAAMIWRYFNIDTTKSILIRLISASWYLAIGLVPFVMYYISKSHYTEWDKTRTSIKFLLDQDYVELIKYAAIYLGPLAIFSFFFIPQIKKSPYLFLAAISGIAASLLMESIFLPGYMPWSRNYLFYYADFIVLTTTCISFIWQSSYKLKQLAPMLLIIGIVANGLITIKYLPNDELFHESETVFNFDPITKYITQNTHEFANQKIYLFWPQGFPTYPEKLLPKDITLAKISTIAQRPNFIPFDLVEDNLPKDAKFVLFYYLKNSSLPKAFSSIPSVQRPEQQQLNHYKILVESIDPWSKGKSGVMLLEKT